MVVAFAIATKRSAKDIVPDIDGPLRPLGARHFNDDKRLPLIINLVHLMVEKNIRAHALRIVRRVPDIRHKFVGIGDADNRMPAFILLDTKNDDAAIGVCERAVRLPERSRHTALRQLELDGIRLALGQQQLDVILRQHTLLSRRSRNRPDFNVVDINIRAGINVVALCIPCRRQRNRLIIAVCRYRI